MCASWAPTKMRCRSPSPSLQPQTERMSATCHHNMCVRARITLTRADSDKHTYTHTRTRAHTHWGVCHSDCVREIVYSVSQTHSPELSLGISTWSQGRARGPVLRPACQQALDKAPSTKPSPVSPGLIHTHIQLKGRRESVWMLYVKVYLCLQGQPHIHPHLQGQPHGHICYGCK